jgi:hypothetical protein
MKLFLTILCLIFFICPVFADYFLSDVNAVYSERLGLMKMYSKATGQVIDYMSYQEYSDWWDEDERCRKEQMAQDNQDLLESIDMKLGQINDELEKRNHGNH